LKELLKLKDTMICDQITSFLEENGIICMVKNKATQNIIEPGNINTGYNLAVGPIQIFVDDKEYEQAKDLLKLSVFSDLFEGDFEKQPTYQT
jgi:hypothetical protein